MPKLEQGARVGAGASSGAGKFFERWNAESEAAMTFDRSNARAAHQQSM